MLRIARIVSAALVGLVVSTSAHASIIVWTKASGGNGHAYEFVGGALVGWDESSAAAQAMTFRGVKGHLATITDGSEQLFINSIPSLDPGFFPDGMDMWLGGFQANPLDPPDQGWAWVTGEPWSFTAWGKSQPDDGFKPESHLVMVIPNPSLGRSSGAWSDLPGAPFMSFSISGFLVEYDVPACASDINGDGVVNGLDLAILLGAWGRCPPGPPCEADINGDGSVDGVDLAILLGNWSIPPGAPGCA